MRAWVLAGLLVSGTGMLSAQDSSFHGPVDYGRSRPVARAVAITQPVVFTSRNCEPAPRPTTVPVMAPLNVAPAPVGYAPAAATPIAAAPVTAAYPAGAPIGNGWYAAPATTVQATYPPVSVPIATAQPVPSHYFVGSAMFGQPKLFSPKQPIRNFFRYITP